MSDGVQITADQAKAARLLLGRGKMHVCRELGIAPQTLDRVELAGARGGPPPDATFARLRKYYEAAGVEFTNEAPGVRLAMQNAPTPGVLHATDHQNDKRRQLTRRAMVETIEQAKRGKRLRGGRSGPDR